MSHPSGKVISALPVWKIIILILASLLSVLMYLAWSSAYYRVGYPLDDAWIHQTYARNLAQTGEWYFLTGVRSAGSTSPLFTVLLLPGYIFRWNPSFWTYLLGWLSLLGIVIAGIKISLNIHPSRTQAAFWTGLFLVFEWHLVWAAVSGMETLLFAFSALLTMFFLSRKPTNWTLIGCMIGISVWIRPDGITLLGPVALLILLDSTARSEKIKASFNVSLGLFGLIAAYLVFNRWSGGSYFPNTFSAKQAEYAGMQVFPIWERYAAQLKMLLVGGGVLLLPGFIYFTAVSIKKRFIFGLAWILWVLGYLFIFAWRLPVTYQHGRYAIPAMAAYFVLGLIGAISLVNDFGQDSHWKRILAKGWMICTAAVLGIFYLLGAQAYSLDVAIIESEMVTAAQWVRQNTPENALVAVHDVGAMGYFSDRRLIDLAGLVSPEVIPIIRDENKLGDYLSEREADFLVVMPGWYQDLSNCLPEVFATTGSFSSIAGGENMVVFRWDAAAQSGRKCQK